MEFIKWFKDISEKDRETAGSNGMNLAILANARFPVPNGFVVTAQAQRAFLGQMNESITKNIKDRNINDQEQLQKSAQSIQQLILKTPFPNELQEAIIDSYELLGVAQKTQAEIIMHGTEEIVTVRPSAIAKLLNEVPTKPPVFHVQGKQNALKAVAACWASLVTPHAISHAGKYFSADDIAASVIIQRMVNSEKAGTISTINPTNSDKEMVILAAYGLGEAVTGCAVASDTYIVDKNMLNIKEARVKEKEFRVFLEQKTGKLTREKLSEGDRRLQALSDKEIYQIARYGRKIHEHFNAPYNIEWAIENDKVYILQCSAHKQGEKKEGKEREVLEQQAVKKITEKTAETAKVNVRIDLPQHAENTAQQTHADGILIRPELIIACSSTHPAHYIREKRDEEYTTHLVKEVKKIVEVFKDKPVVFCNSDMRSDEYRNLKGGNKEPFETDPIIGWRGLRRLLDEPRILQAEFSAVKRLHEQGYKNISIMLPFGADRKEVRIAIEMLKKAGLDAQTDVKLGVMIETPASCLTIAGICEEGIHFACINIDSLAQLTLGVDGHNIKVKQHFDSMHPAVLNLIEIAIKECKERGVETGACGDITPQMAKFLVEHGIDSIYAKPDAVHKIRNIVTQMEKKVLLDVERKGMESG